MAKKRTDWRRAFRRSRVTLIVGATILLAVGITTFILMLPHHTTPAVIDGSDDLTIPFGVVLSDKWTTYSFSGSVVAELETNPSHGTILHLVADKAAGGVLAAFDPPIDVRRYPTMTLDVKILEYPEGPELLNEDGKEMDHALQVFLLQNSLPNTDGTGYCWSRSTPVGSWVDEQVRAFGIPLVTRPTKTVSNKENDSLEWTTHTLSIKAPYLKQVASGLIGAIAIVINSDDTRSRAACLISPPVFREANQSDTAAFMKP